MAKLFSKEDVTICSHQQSMRVPYSPHPHQLLALSVCFFNLNHWTEEPGGLQCMGSLGVEHDWTTSFSRFSFMHWRRKCQLTPVFLPGESQGRGSALSRTRLKRLSSSSSRQETASLQTFFYIFFNLWFLTLKSMVLFLKIWGEVRRCSRAV